MKNTICIHAVEGAMAVAGILLCLNQHQYLAAASITQSIANQLVTSTGISYKLNGSLPHMPWATSPNPQATSNFLSKDLSSSPAACCLKEDASYASTKRIRLNANVAPKLRRILCQVLYSIVIYNVNMTLIKGIAIKKFSGAPNTTKSTRPKSPSIV